MAKGFQLSLTVKEISYSYPESEKAALDSVSFSLAEHEYLAVLGANGSGKSTLSRCIAGLIKPSRGTVVRGEVPPGAVPVALVFQSPSDQIVAETVELDTAFGPENLGLGRDEMRSRVTEALETFSLANFASSPTNKLSSGQKQHLALAGVRVLNPGLLVLDEPTSMLSPSMRLSVLSYLDRFHLNGGTVLHVTHDLSEAARAQRVLVLDEGHLVFDGNPALLADRPKEVLEKWGLYGAIPPVRKSHAGGEEVIGCAGIDSVILRDFNFSARKGTITAIAGESGSGKSLLLEIMAGIHPAESGIVRVTPGETLALAVQESEASLFNEFVADDVAFAPRNAGLGGKDLIARVRNAMDLAGLPFDQFTDRRTFSLSGGERRKAALAGIIAMDTSIVLLDDPSSGLDTRSRSQLLRLILGLRDAGKTVIFTTNRTEEFIIADQVLTLKSPETDAAGGAPNASAGILAESVRGPAEAKGSPVKPFGKTSRSSELKSLDRLRAGSGGLWLSLDTPLHRLPPVFKYILAISAITAALAVQGWVALCLLIAINLIPVAISRYPFRRLVIGILKILPWFIFIGVFQYFVSHDLLSVFLFILRFIALYIPLSLFVFVTSHTEIMYGMEDLLCFLKIFRIPVRDIALLTGLVFRFLPLLYEEAYRITVARIIRSMAGKHKKGLMVKISSMASLFVPLILRTLSRASHLSEAITARYYGTGKNSRYSHWKIGIGQIILVLAVPVLTGVLIFVSVYFQELKP